MRVNGPSRTDLDQTGDEFAGLVERGIEQAARVVTKDLKATWTGDDLGIIRTVFDRYTEDTLLPELAKQYQRAVTEQADRITVAALSVTAAIVLPSPPDVLAEQYLQTATNRLKGISDEVWHNTRDELTTGMQAGESIPQLRKRVMSAADVSKARATVIARTEVIGAQNRGSLGQMMSAGYGGTKDWLATRDTRTRVSHKNANGQTVRMDEKFHVGIAEMDGPHDPSAPPGETISCRCTLTYDLDESDVQDQAVALDPLRLAADSGDATAKRIGDWGVERVTFRDGTRAIRRLKGSPTENLSQAIGEAVGAPIAHGAVDSSGRLVQEIVDGYPPESFRTWRKHLTSEGGRQLGLFDYATGQGDRHNGNWFVVTDPVTDTNGPVGIDHEFSFGVTHSPFTSANDPASYTTAEIDSFLNRIRPLEKFSTTSGLSHEYATMIKRLTYLRKHHDWLPGSVGPVLE